MKKKQSGVVFCSVLLPGRIRRNLQTNLFRVLLRDEIAKRTTWKELLMISCKTTWTSSNRQLRRHLNGAVDPFEHRWVPGKRTNYSSIGKWRINTELWPSNTHTRSTNTSETTPNTNVFRVSEATTPSSVIWVPPATSTTIWSRWWPPCWTKTADLNWKKWFFRNLVEAQVAEDHFSFEQVKRCSPKHYSLYSF